MGVFYICKPTPKNSTCLFSKVAFVLLNRPIGCNFMKWITDHLQGSWDIRSWKNGKWAGLTGQQLAAELQNWTMEHWWRWSGFLHHMDGRVCGCLTWGEHQHQEARRANGGCVMLWAMFYWERLGAALHVGVTLTSTTYLSILSHQDFPWWLWPCPKAKLVQEFEVLTWPPTIQDLNPTQRLWEVLWTIVLHGDPTSEATGLEGCSASWCQVPQIPQPTFRGLVESMPRWIRVIWAAKRGKTQY